MNSVGPDLPAGFEPAGIAPRLAAMVYEALIAFAIALVAGFGFHGATSGPLTGSARHWFQVYLFLVLGAYFVLCWHRGGRTLPMQAWGLRLMAADGRPPSLARAMLRYLLAWVSLLALGGGILWAFFDRERQFLHDRIGGTRIVRIARRGT